MYTCFLIDSHSHYSEFSETKKCYSHYSEFSETKKCYSHYSEFSETKKCYSHYSDFPGTKNVILNLSRRIELSYMNKKCCLYE